MKFRVVICIWEHDEYVLAIRPENTPASSDLPIGCILSYPDAIRIREWLETALPEIQELTANAELAALRQRVAELEAENAFLHQRIAELEDKVGCGNLRKRKLGAGRKAQMFLTMTKSHAPYAAISHQF